MPLDRQQDRAPRPPMRLVMTTPIHCIAFGFGTGCSPIGPGTVGTVLGLPLFALLAPLGWELYVLASALLFVIGVWICSESSRLLGVHDSPGIVFDEIVGMLIAATPLVPALGLSPWPWWAGLGLAFVAFRVFDILKPWPIKWLDRHVHGGFGIMVDDLLAGVFAAAIVVAACAIVR